MKRGSFKKPTYEEALAKKKARKVTKSPVAKKKPKSKEKTHAQLKKELDRVFSLYIRQKDADENGMVACYTCGKVMHWKQIQAGHFVSRQFLATRWDENNVKPQCAGCNIFGNGKPLDFEERLKKELGNDFVEKMKASRHQTMKLDRNWYKEQIDTYKSFLV